MMSKKTIFGLGLTFVVFILGGIFKSKIYEMDILFGICLLLISIVGVVLVVKGVREDNRKIEQSFEKEDKNGKLEQRKK